MDALTMPLAMPKKKQRKGPDFGTRLVEARQARGMTQIELAEAIGSSQRAISAYETLTCYPPAPVLAQIAQALHVSTDELLGLKLARATKHQIEDPEERRLWRKFRQILELPEKDQRAIVRLLNSLVRSPAGKAG